MYAVWGGRRKKRPGEREFLIPAGFFRENRLEAFDQQEIAEHVAHSWFFDYEGGRHPSQGETRPYASGQESNKYSWAKAPRYKDFPCETGALAEMVIGGHPLFLDLTTQYGSTVFTRQFARLVKPAVLLPVMDSWLLETIHHEGKFYVPPGEITEGEGFGLTEGPRGALGHWVRIAHGTIQQYQIITPTTWNASPRDSHGVPGPWEHALVGTKVDDMFNPVELGHVVRSFDACLVCTVHAVSGKQRENTFSV